MVDNIREGYELLRIENPFNEFPIIYINYKDGQKLYIEESEKHKSLTDRAIDSFYIDTINTGEKIEYGIYVKYK